MSAADLTPEAMPQLFSLEGKTALVTGATSGIGRMIASGLSSAGAVVYITARSAVDCERVAGELASSGSCQPLPGDLSTEAGCQQVIERFSERQSKLDILVNNAGITMRGAIEDVDDGAWDTVLSLNVKGLFHLTKFALPLLRAAGTPNDPARVVNIGSAGGLFAPAADNFAYSASKAAVHQLTPHLAKHLAPNITVNAIAPGIFPSAITASLEDALRATAAALPLQRIGTPPDAAGTAVFLCSRAGAYITGAVISLDGGLVALR